MTAIWASWLWAPTPVARATMRPVRFIVPPRTVDPTVVSTGIGSPVIIEVSTLDDPSTISPSAARVSPARVTKRSLVQLLDGHEGLDPVAQHARISGRQLAQGRQHRAS